MTVNERFASAIEALGKKKTQVAKDLGISDSSVSTICSGKSNPSRQTLKAFSDLYGVRMEWLISGEGEMMPAMSHDEQIVSYVAKMIKGDDDFQRALVELILTRTPEELAVLRKAFEDLAAKFKTE